MNDRPRILLADDEHTFRVAVSRLLDHAGYVVEQVGSANEALEQLESSVFDLLIADLHMPGNHNLAVLHEQDRVPVLVVTGEPCVDSAVGALRGAAVDYLTKPFAPERLLARVADGVARGQAMRRLRTTEQQLRRQLEALMDLRNELHVAGGVALAREISQQPNNPAGAKLPDSIAELLSPREREVLTEFVGAPRIADVAENLHLSQHTVKNHFRSIYRKLGVSSQAELLSRLGQAR